METPGIAPIGPLVVNAPRPVHLLRRLGAICYDALLLIAVLFIAGLPLPLIPEAVRLDPWVRYTIFLYMLGVGFVFFGWFWTHGGQTLGMRAWRFRVVDAERRGITWKLAWRRFAWSMVSWLAAGLGFLWSLFDPGRAAWHDHLSGTYLVHILPASQTAQHEQADGEEHQGR